MFQSFSALVASISQAGSQTIDKYIVSNQKINFKVYLVSSFIISALITFPLFIFFGKIQPQAIKFYWIALLFFGIILTGIVNIIYYRALQHEKVSELQPIVMLAPLFTVIISGLFLKDERNLIILALAIVSSLALFWAHFEKKKLKFNKYVIPLLIFVAFVSPFSAIIAKKLLEIYNPFALEFIRTLILLPFLWIFLKPDFKNLKGKNPVFLILTNTLTTIAWILILFSYTSIGIVQTVLILNLYPVMVYVFARMFLEEKIYWKNWVALIVIIISVTIAQIYK